MPHTLLNLRWGAPSLRGRCRKAVGPDMVAGPGELVRLVACAAGGLSDRDRELLELSYRHGLDVGELAMVLGVTPGDANARVLRLRQTVGRCLGPLLVALGVRNGRHACPELADILTDWDGEFSDPVRRRIGRHIDFCPTCARERRQRVNPRALLGGAPAFLPAPDWLRSRTLNAVRKKVCDDSASDAPTREGSPTGVAPLRRRFP